MTSRVTSGPAPGQANRAPDAGQDSRGPAAQTSWYFLELGDGLTSSVACGEIEDRFATAFAAAGRPAAMAVFKRHDSSESLHCEVTAYFSPDAGEIARAMGARPCVRPLRAGLGLLAGDPGCWTALFE